MQEAPTTLSGPHVNSLRPLENLRRAFGYRRRSGLTEELAVEPPQSFIGRSVAGVINVMLQIIEQLVRGLISLIQIAGQHPMKDLVESTINTLIQRAKI